MSFKDFLNEAAWKKVNVGRTLTIGGHDVEEYWSNDSGITIAKIGKAQWVVVGYDDDVVHTAKTKKECLDYYNDYYR